MSHFVDDAGPYYEEGKEFAHADVRVPFNSGLTQRRFMQAGNIYREGKEVYAKVEGNGRV